MHMIDGEELGEMSIDRMMEENDTEAPIEQICVDLCEKLIPERRLQVARSEACFPDPQRQAGSYGRVIGRSVAIY